MNTISNHNAAATLQLPATLPLRGNSEALPMLLKGGKTSEPFLNPSLQGRANASGASLQGRGTTDELREKFTQFVGEAFYGQMLKAMRSTVGKPAYFNGGRAEEVFQGQLDQTMAEQFTKASAAKFVEPMFARQFPQLAEAKPASGLGDLSQLRRH